MTVLSTLPAAIEAAARALCVADGMDPSGIEGVHDDPMWVPYMPDATAALRAIQPAIEAAGFVVVPREPTERMLEAATEWIRDDMPSDWICRRIWTAMLAAVARQEARDGE